LTAKIGVSVSVENGVLGLTLITNHVLPGTTIVTDAWRGYQNVAVIVHANEFVDSVDPDIHTETIEGM